jgi:DUF1680 family protein
MKAYLLAALLISSSFTGETAQLPDQVPSAVPDLQLLPSPDMVQLSGWVGSRVLANESNRLAKLDPARLLEGYQHRPGRQAWDGEHVGKWLHAATLAWLNTGDAALRKKMDLVASELCQCQLQDGYLGTYLEKDRWSEWDVWSHKYNLIGLLTYVRHTGNTEPMRTCRRMGDLLCATFGDSPGKRDLMASGHHLGMASSSVLEPMVLLYRQTGEPRYLEFCRYIIRAWEQPAGPHILSTLLQEKRVDKVANAKAYEMLSCLNGALELYRTTGDQPLLEACLNAWQDIVKNRLYLTGAASYCETFHGDFDLPNVNNVGETCVTVTWLQFNANLLRLTGEARFAEQIERAALNQLLGAQRPDGAGWGYYVEMQGRKPYRIVLDGQCCLSSGPRGVALLPSCAIATDAEGAVVNLFDAAQARLVLRDGTPLTLKLDSFYPASGKIHITLHPASEKEFALKLRIPDWCQRSSVAPDYGASRGKDGYLAIKRRWKPGDSVDLNLELEPRVVVGDHLNQGKAAILYGPLVLAADESLQGTLAPPLNSLALPNTSPGSLGISPTPPPEEWRTWPGAREFRVRFRSAPSNAPFTGRLIPFADAGMKGARYKVWLPLVGQTNANLALSGVETRSREGNQDGSINDDDFASFAVTFDGQKALADWYAITFPAPVKLKRIVFAHGRNFHDGGWFDTTLGKPMVQIQRRPNAQWETLGKLTDYPATTATDGNRDRLTWANKQFVFRLPAPEEAAAVRVIGRPSCGDNPNQSFSSCSELQIFDE